MRKRPKYEIEIDVQDYSIDGPVWRNYDILSSEGDTLDELLGNAVVSIMDQDGSEVGLEPADAEWMQALIVVEYERLSAGSNTGGGALAMLAISALLCAFCVGPANAANRKYVRIESSAGEAPYCLITPYGFKLCAYQTLGACLSALERRGGGICVPN